MRKKSEPHPDKEETQLIGGHFPKSLAKDLRRVAVEEDTTIRALLEQAINRIVSEHGKKATREMPHRPSDDKTN